MEICAIVGLLLCISFLVLYLCGGENMKCIDKSAFQTAWDFGSRQMRDLFNSTSDGMIVVNEMGVIILINIAAERILGIPVQDAYGQLARDVITGSRLDCVLETGIAELNQKQMIGETYIVTNRVPLRDEKDQIVGVAAVFREFTEVEQLMEELTSRNEMQKFLETIIDVTQDAISVADQEGKIIMVNQAYTQVIGMPKEEVVGKLSTVDIREGESMHLQVVKTLDAVRGIPLKVGPGNREVLASVSPIIIKGKLRGSVGVVHDVSEIKRLSKELARTRMLVNRSQSRYTFETIVATDAAMSLAVEQSRHAATTPATILLSGESGTGKEVFAHSIHFASHRNNKPFVRVNCAALPETLFESELFGYEAGAFSGALRGGKKGLFEEANGGTIFLDEIGEIPLMVQAKLLRVLQEREFTKVGGVKSRSIDVRVIAATNQNLDVAVKKGSFREDLYYRLNVFPIVIPPLRHRMADLPQLIVHILEKLNQEYGRNVTAVSPEAIAVFREYLWPGNVRELENVLGRALINMQFSETTILNRHLPPFFREIKVAHIVDTHFPHSSLTQMLEAVERKIIEDCLKKNEGNRTQTAFQLGIAIRSLYYKMEKLKIKSEVI
jgi:PAS domain S-box-containing protein